MTIASMRLGSDAGSHAGERDSHRHDIRIVVLLGVLSPPPRRFHHEPDDLRVHPEGPAVKVTEHAAPAVQLVAERFEPLGVLVERQLRRLAASTDTLSVVIEGLFGDWRPGD